MANLHVLLLTDQERADTVLALSEAQSRAEYPSWSPARQFAGRLASELLADLIQRIHHDDKFSEDDIGIIITHLAAAAHRRSIERGFLSRADDAESHATSFRYRGDIERMDGLLDRICGTTGRQNPRGDDEEARIVRIANSVGRRAAALLGSTDAANAWLKTPLMDLEGRRPLDVMRTPPGVLQVDAVLAQLEANRRQ